MENRWNRLYKVGAVAPLIALVLYFSEFMLPIFGPPYPGSTEGWFTLFQRSKLLGLWYLNALDILSFTLLGLMFLALYVALREIHPSWSLIALYFAVLGVAVFIVPRVLTLSILPLSDLHAAATSASERSIYLTAGETLSHAATATPQTLGFLFTAIAGLICSLLFRRGGPFGRSATYVGIAGSVAALANYVSAILAAPIADVLMPINGTLWFVWWVMMSLGLFRLAREC